MTALTLVVRATGASAVGVVLELAQALSRATQTRLGKTQWNFMTLSGG
jgi:hypothetical protein